ncbi:MAG: hypothetical protein ABIF71_14280 [Planctomycetota bacterium]
MNRLLAIGGLALVVFGAGCGKQAPPPPSPKPLPVVELPPPPPPPPRPAVDKVDYAALKPAALPVDDRFVFADVPAKAVRPEWDTFDILVWQYLTNVEEHHALWEAMGFMGFHVDRGGSETDRKWAVDKVCYQDHAAGKGYLHALEREVKAADSGYGTTVNLSSHGGWVHPRPRPLTDPAVLAKMFDEFKKNVTPLVNTKRMLIAFDDEIAIGTFTSPVEVCGHPNTVKEFQEYLRWRYANDLNALNKQWGTATPRVFVVTGENTAFPEGSVRAFLRQKYGAAYQAFVDKNGDLEPVILKLSGDKSFPDLPAYAFFQPYMDFATIPAISFEWVRKKKDVPLKEWNLAAWADFRDYMDRQFARVLRQLTVMSNEIDPSTPAGFVGSSAPSAWGGHNYSLLKKVVQWMEAYDIGATNEILRGLNPALTRVQTCFPPADWKLCTWFLSYYAAHRNKCVIMWPAEGEDSLFTAEGKTGIDGVDDRLKQAAPYVKTLVGAPSKALLAARMIADPIAIYYSQPSIRAVWAMDSECHGRTWPARSSSLDNYSNSYHQTFTAWCKLLEDLGYQYEVIDEEQLFAGRLNALGTRVLVLPKAVALSAAEVAAFHAFAEAGGLVVADNLPGIFDEHGTGLADDAMPVTGLFNCTRESARGIFDGSQVCELNGEAGYGQVGNYDILPAVHAKAKQFKGLPVAEVGLTATTAEDVAGSAVMVRNKTGRGQAVLMNLSVLRYLDMQARVGAVGAAAREAVGGLLGEIGLKPAVTVTEAGGPCPVTEVLRLVPKDGGLLVAMIKNPTRQGTITGLGDIPGVPAEPITVTVNLGIKAKKVRDIMKGADLVVNSDGLSVTLAWNPWKMLLLQVEE